MLQIKDHFGETASIVVHDGALGSHPEYEVRARIVTDDPAVAVYHSLSFLWYLEMTLMSYLHHVIPRVTIGTPLEFQHPITAYIVSKFDTKQLAGLGITSILPSFFSLGTYVM